MKIAVVGTRGIPSVLGGVETHCQNLYPLIIDDNLSVTLFARSPYVSYKSSSFGGVSLKTIWAPKNKSFEAIVHTFLAVLKAKSLKSDIVHIHAIGPGIIVPFARLLGMKVVFTHHGADYERGKWGRIAKLVLKAGEKLAAKYSNEVIVISNVIKDSLAAKYGRDNCHLIPNGVDKPTRIENPDCFLAKHSLAKRKFIVCVGRFVQEKGFHDLLTAYQNIDTDLKLVIVGDADHETQYSKELKRNARDLENVVLTGFLSGDELVSVFSNAALFVMPSYHEGLPIALLEAMSYRLPLLVSDIPANMEVGLAPDNYFKVGDIADLTPKLSTKIELDISQVDYSSYLSRYDWKVIASQTTSVYEQLVTTQ